MSKIREGHVVAAAAVVALPVAAFVPKGMAPLLAIVAAGVLLVRWQSHREFPRIARRLWVAVAVFLLYALVSAIWSRTPGDSAFAVLPLAGTMIGGLVLMTAAIAMDDADRRIAVKGIVFGVAAGLVLLASERLDKGALLRWMMVEMGRKPTPMYDAPLHFNRGMTVAALLLWPLAAALCARSNRVAFLVFAAGVAVVGAADAFAPIAGVALGVSAAALIWAMPRIGPRVFAAAIAAGVLFAPLIPHALPSPVDETKSISFLSNPALHRLYIWRVTADLIRERPVLGYGFDTSRSFYNRHQRVQETLRRDDPKRTFVIDYEPIPLHPHNMVLQVWLELGGVGALAMLGVLLSVVVAIVKSGLGRLETSICFGFFTTALLIAAVSFGAWQAWWLSTLWLCGALMTLSAIAAGRESPSRHAAG